MFSGLRDTVNGHQHAFDTQKLVVQRSDLRNGELSVNSLVKRAGVLGNDLSSAPSVGRQCQYERIA